jgi:bacterioferritin-associated ferredoxin
MLDFEDNYEVCNCKKVTYKDIKDVILNKEATSLREIQELTTAGTECRHCIFPEGDFGKIKKSVYCKDILKDLNG